MDIIELGKKNNDIPYILVFHSFVVEKVPIMYAIRMVKLNSKMKKAAPPPLPYIVPQTSISSCLDLVFISKCFAKKKRKSADY